MAQTAALTAVASDVGAFGQHDIERFANRLRSLFLGQRRVAGGIGFARLPKGRRQSADEAQREGDARGDRRWARPGDQIRPRPSLGKSNARIGICCGVHPTIQ